MSKPRFSSIGREMYDIAVKNFTRAGFLVPVLVMDGPRRGPEKGGRTSTNVRQAFEGGEREKELLAAFMVKLVIDYDPKYLVLINEVWLKSSATGPRVGEALMVTVLRDDYWMETYMGLIRRGPGDRVVVEDVKADLQIQVQGGKFSGTWLDARDIIERSGGRP